MTALPSAADDEAHIQAALSEARAATAHDDVPIGAVIVRGDEVIARAHNRREVDRDPTGHAELLALRDAAKAIGSWRLDDCALYVTLEPCAMCAGAAILSRIPLVVFGTPDPKAGAVISVTELFAADWANHRPRWRMGARRAECEALLSEFFASRRSSS